MVNIWVSFSKVKVVNVWVRFSKVVHLKRVHIKCYQECNDFFVILPCYGRGSFFKLMVVFSLLGLKNRSWVGSTLR